MTYRKNEQIRVQKQVSKDKSYNNYPAFCIDFGWRRSAQHRFGYGLSRLA